MQNKDQLIIIKTVSIIKRDILKKLSSRNFGQLL